MLPLETILAVFPPSAEVGKIHLLPMTLYHAVAMEASGVDLSKGIETDEAYIAAWVLSMRPDELREVFAGGDKAEAFKAWMDGVEEPVYKVKSAVNEIVGLAFKLNIPGEQKDKVIIDAATGMGWPLEMAEFIAHEYSMTMDEALETNMGRAFAMTACCRVRNNGRHGGPDYYERMRIEQIHKTIAEAKRKARAEDGGRD